MGSSRKTRLSGPDKVPPGSTAPIVPPAPTTLLVKVVASEVFPKRLTLSWPATAGVSAYDVYRRLDSQVGQWTKVNAKPVAGTSFTDAGLAPSTKYVYRVSRAGEPVKLASPAMAVTTRSIPNAVTVTTTPGTSPAPTILPPTVQPLTITVTASVGGLATIAATDPQGRSLTYTKISGPASFTVSGAVAKYVPTGAENTTAVVRVSNGAEYTDLTVVLVALAPSVNLPPVVGPVNFTAIVGQATPVDLPVTSLDGITAIETFGSVVNASVTFDVAARRAFVTAAVAGPVSFGFRASDGVSWSPVAQAIGVAAIANRPPAANNQSISTNQGQSVEIKPAVTDPDGDTYTCTIVTPPTHGTAVPQPGGEILYTPAPGYVGGDSYQYFATDSRGAKSNTATQTISVKAVAPSPSNVTVVQLSLANTEAQNAALFVNAMRSAPTGTELRVDTYKTAARYRVGFVGNLRPDLSYRSDGVIDNQSVDIEFTDPAQPEPAATLDVKGLVFLSAKKYFVSATGSSNGAGTRQDPVTFVRAKALAAGSWCQIVYLAGTYRGGNQVHWLPKSQQRPARHVPIAIVDEPGVIIDGGEDVTGWTRLGTSDVWYASWTTDLIAPEPGPITNRLYKTFADPFGRAAGFCWYDSQGVGLPLLYGHDFADHLTPPAQLKPGEFTLDPDAGRVYVRLHYNGDPNFVRVVGFKDQFAFRSEYFDANKNKTFGAQYPNVYLSLRDIRHFASWPKAINGAVLTSDGWTIRNLGLRFCSGHGLAVGGNDVQVRNVTIEWIGHIAIGNTRGKAGIGVSDLEGLRWNYRLYAGFKSSDPNNLGGGQFELTCKFANTLLAVFLRWNGRYISGPFLHLDIRNYGFRIEHITCADGLPTGVPDYSKSIGDTCVVFIEVSPAAVGGVRGIIRYIRGIRIAGCVIKHGESQGYDVDFVVAIDCRAVMTFRQTPTRKLLPDGDPLFETRDIHITGVKARGFTYGYEFTGQNGAWAGDDVFSRLGIFIGGGTFDDLKAVYRYGGNSYTPAQATAKFGANVGVGDAIGAVN